MRATSDAGRSGAGASAVVEVRTEEAGATLGAVERGDGTGAQNGVGANRIF